MKVAIRTLCYHVISDTAEGQRVFLEILKNQRPDLALLGLGIGFSENTPNLCYFKERQNPSLNLKIKGLEPINTTSSLATISSDAFFCPHTAVMGVNGLTATFGGQVFRIQISTQITVVGSLKYNV